MAKTKAKPRRAGRRDETDRVEDLGNLGSLGLLALLGLLGRGDSGFQVPGLGHGVLDLGFSGVRVV